MADIYLLEGSGVDGYLLEDGTGVLNLEANRDWVPTDLGAACVGWFDLSSASKVTLNTGNISAVTNDAGGSVTLTQGTGANQPPFTAGSGASFVLAGATSLSIANLSTATEYHYFIVGTPNANTSFRTALWAATNEHPLLIQTGTDNVGHYISGFQQFTSVTALAAAEAQFYAHITPSAVSSGAINGNTPASTPSAYGATNTNAAVLGNSSGGSQGFGWIKALVIVTGTLTSGDRQKVEGYLAWKYSSVNNLPSGHPYASAQPTIAIATGLSGSSSLSFAPSATLLGQGAVSASSTLTFAPSATLLGTGAVSGSSSLAFSPSGTVNGLIAGTSTLLLSPSATLFGAGSISGTSAVAFAPSAMLLGRGAVSGASALTFAPSSTLLGRGAVVGSSTIVFSPSATLFVASAISGTASLTFGGSGTLLGAGALLGSTALSLSAAATLLGTGQLQSVSSLSFAGSAALLGIGQLAGSTSFSLTVSGQLVFGFSGQIKVNILDAEQAKPVKVWDGSAWVTKPLKYWDGVEWKATAY